MVIISRSEELDSGEREIKNLVRSGGGVILVLSKKLVLDCEDSVFLYLSVRIDFSELLSDGSRLDEILLVRLLGGLEVEAKGKIIVIEEERAVGIDGLHVSLVVMDRRTWC
jgi:hypothetical protein